MNYEKKKAIPEEGAFLEVGKLFKDIFERIILSQADEMPMYDSVDLKRILHVSDSWLYRMRKSNQIPYKKLGRKFYYPKAFFTKAFKS